ncbi:hypothetical protein [Methylobacterium mesophilicum]
MTDAMGALERDAGQTGETAKVVLSAARRLATQSEQLGVVVHHFLSEVKAA